MIVWHPSVVPPIGLGRTFRWAATVNGLPLYHNGKSVGYARPDFAAQFTPNPGQTVDAVAEALSTDAKLRASFGLDPIVRNAYTDLLDAARRWHKEILSETDPANLPRSARALFDGIEAYLAAATIGPR